MVSNGGPAIQNGYPQEGKDAVLCCYFLFTGTGDGFGSGSINIYHIKKVKSVDFA